MSDNGKNGNGNGRRPGRWQAFTLDTELDRVRALFEHRHGCPPSEVVQSGPILLAGPIAENVLQRPHGTQAASNTAICKTGQEQGETFQATLGATGGPPSLLARVAAAHVDVTPERARQLALSFEGVTT